MNILRKLIASPFVGFKWVKALELTSRENYQAALSELDHLDQFYRGKNVEYHMLRGFLSYGVEEDIEAVRNFELSIALLQDSNRYNNEEKKYLLAYGTTFGRRALKSESNLSDSSRFPEIDISLIDLSKVSKAIKKNFPLTDHPDWR